MKIDIYTHIYSGEFIEMFNRKSRSTVPMRKPQITTVEQRLKVMDANPEVVQVITLNSPPLETLPKADAIELCRFGNDRMAEITAKYPDRFVAAVACIPLNDIDAALGETERTIKKLGFKGVQIYTNVNGEPVSAPRFRPLFELMQKLDLPIWMHPLDPPGWGGKWYENQLEFGWPFHSSVAMLDLARSGVMDSYPNIKIITHHCGGLIPYHWLRAKPSDGILRRFYADTAIHDVIPALMCGLDFYGADHIVFGTDMPWGWGDPVKATIAAIEQMPIPPEQKQKIFEGNARRLLKLK